MPSAFKQQKTVYCNTMHPVFLGGITATATILLITGYFLYRRHKKDFRLVGTVSRLCIFPIKSCGGIDIQAADCTQFGLKVEGLRDRQWMILDSADHFVTIRQHPKLALTKTRVSPDGQFLHLNGENMPSIAIPVVPKEIKIVKTRYRGIPLEGQHCGQEAAKWLCTYLKEDGLKLIKFDESMTERDLSKDHAYGFMHRPGEKALFHDESQFHLCAEESVEDLNTRLERPVTVDNFRPNFVIKGCSPYQEDSWSYINIGGKVTLRKALRTGRCKVPTVDLEKGELTAEPVQTLRKYRLCEDDCPAKKKYGTSPLFGIHLVARNYATISVGDTVYAC